MNFCFISYWGVREGLTQATVIPHLEILMSLKQVDKIHFISMERAVGNAETIDIPGVTHHHIKSSESTLDKLTDRNKVFQRMEKLQTEEPIDFIIARGVMAGWLSLKIVKRYSIPLSVESYEPHADYMVEDGIWRKNGVRYRILRKAEIEELKIAKYVFPVSEAYRIHLIKHSGANPERVVVMPCCVNIENFKFNEVKRTLTRTQLGLSAKNIVGIYTGKLGGIYLDEEAIEIIKHTQTFFGRDIFRLIILSPAADKWREKLIFAGFNESEFAINCVPQSDVGDFLSAADFGLSLHRPTPSKMGISPIKNGEYLANGLPIIMPDGIGDDSKIIREKGFGVIIDDVSQIGKTDLSPLLSIINKDRITGKLAQYAREYRSFNIVRNNYLQLIESQ